MRRETTKHGPRLDDALARETRSLEQGAPIEPRVEEWKEQESPGETERDVDARTAPPGSLGGDDVEGRRELSRHLADCFGGTTRVEAERSLFKAPASGPGIPRRCLEHLGIDGDSLQALRHNRLASRKIRPV